MIISEKIKTIVLEAEAKVLGTTSQSNEINVVPISMVKIEEDAIYIFNFFMQKTLANIQSDSNVSFTCWSGLSGVQIKGQVEYLTSGIIFDELTTWVKSENPERVVLGVLKITPQHIFDIGPAKDIPKEDLRLNN